MITHIHIFAGWGTLATHRAQQKPCRELSIIKFRCENSLCVSWRNVCVHKQPSKLLYSSAGKIQMKHFKIQWMIWILILTLVFTFVIGFLELLEEQVLIKVFFDLILLWFLESWLGQVILSQVSFTGNLCDSLDLGVSDSSSCHNDKWVAITGELEDKHWGHLVLPQTTYIVSTWEGLLDSSN